MVCNIFISDSDLRKGRGLYTVQAYMYSKIVYCKCLFNVKLKGWISFFCVISQEVGYRRLGLFG
jgi:hypothetical protein